MRVTASNEHFDTADTTVAHAATAFDVAFRVYKLGPLPVESIVQPAGDVSVPRDLGGDVLSVVGLSAPALMPPPAASRLSARSARITRSTAAAAGGRR